MTQLKRDIERLIDDTLKLEPKLVLKLDHTKLYKMTDTPLVHPYPTQTSANALISVNSPLLPAIKKVVLVLLAPGATFSFPLSAPPSAAATQLLA